jgi:hypothetical protein
MNGVEGIVIVYGLSLFMIGNHYPVQQHTVGLGFSICLLGAAWLLDEGKSTDSFDFLGSWMTSQIYAPVFHYCWLADSDWDLGGWDERGADGRLRADRAISERTHLPPPHGKSRRNRTYTAFGVTLGLHLIISALISRGDICQA